jgi:hypothetical protein
MNKFNITIIRDSERFIVAGVIAAFVKGDENAFRSLVT